MQQRLALRPLRLESLKARRVLSCNVSQLIANQPLLVAGSVSAVSFSGEVTASSSYNASWQVVDQNTQQVVASGSGTDFNFTPSQNPDIYVATLTATDAQNETSSASVSIGVIDLAQRVAER